ncbi:MAG: PEGA domain-containing protein [Methylococcales bacterium]
MNRLVCITFALSLTGCASTTVINSEPNGATVYLNGEKVGTTPYKHTDTKIILSTNTVQLKKDGYQDFTSAFSRNENVNVGALVGGLLVAVPFLWVMDYKPSYSYEMVPLKGTASQ